MGINPNILSVKDLGQSSIGYTSVFNLSVNSAEYTENENGERKFFISGVAAINTSSITSERRFRERFTTTSAHVVAGVYDSNGKEITRTKDGGNVYNNWVRQTSKGNPRPVPRQWSIEILGINNLPDDIMTVKLIVRADNSGASNIVTVTKTLVSNLSEETILKRQLEKQNKINLDKIISIKPIIIPTTTPEIIPAVVATSSLLPLGIIALLLYSRTGRK